MKIAKDVGYSDVGSVISGGILLNITECTIADVMSLDTAVTRMLIRFGKKRGSYKKREGRENDAAVPAVEPTDKMDNKSRTGKGTYSNVHQIPFNYTTDRKKYQVAWVLCKKYGLPYPEAIKKHEEAQQKKAAEKIARKSGKQVKKLGKPAVVLPGSEDPLKSDKVDKPKQAAAFNEGGKVRQVKGQSPAYGVGTVLTVAQAGEQAGKVQVAFGHDIRWLPPDYLARAGD